MLTTVDRDIWICDGPRVPFLGLAYPTRMAVVRLRGGDLWIWSPIHLVPELRSEVDALGPVRHLVAPNKLHHLALAEWARAWPQARMYAPPGLVRRRRDLSFQNELRDAPDPGWAADIDQVIFHGSLAMDEVVFFHRASATVIFTDLIQRHDPATVHGWRRLFMRLDGLVGPDGSTPREWRLSFWNRRAARAAKQKVLGWNPRHLIIAHGDCAWETGGAIVERGLRWLD